MPIKTCTTSVIENADHTPATDILHRELDECLLKFGSYVSIIKNKTLNNISTIVEIIGDDKLQQDLCEYLSCEKFEFALCLVFTYNPELTKSKVIRDNIKAWRQRGNNRKSKKII